MPPNYLIDFRKTLSYIDAMYARTPRLVRRQILSLSFCLFAAAPCHAAERPPNVLFILVDDYGIKDVGIEGSTFYETPHIDKLARSGMRFTQGYSACQVCSPSRASILLGKTPARHGITDWIGAGVGEAFARQRQVKLLPAEYSRNLPAADATLAEALKQAGYSTFFAGKWHLGSKGSWPEDHGFDINKGGWDAGSPMGGYFAPWQNPNLPGGPPGESLTQRLASETIAFMEQHRNKPFLAYLSFYAVHGPIQTTKALWSKYREKASTLQKPAARFKIDRTLPVRQVQDNPVYAGLIENMDTAVGRVLQSLEALGLADRTIVCFTSDNGGVSSGDNFSSSELPYRGGKGRQWEGGLRVPFYIRAPGVTRPQSTCDTPVIGADFYPTVLELAGLPLRPQQHVDGVSLVPLLKGSRIEPRPLYWHYPHYGNQGGEPSSIIRKGDWKLIHYWEDDRNELYNLPNDIGEQLDLAAAEPQRTGRLWTELQAWLKETGAKIPRANPEFQPAWTAQHQKAALEQKERLEHQHAAVLEPDWQPDPTWWKSLQRPNTIFILSDDLAQGDLGCYGQKLIQTPNLDRMAREGTRYTQAYCGTSVCAPSRASLITGLHSGRSPIRGNWEVKPEGQLPLPAGTVTVASILKSAGYTTACMGKWGMGMFHTTGSPLKSGFEHFFGYNCQRHAHSYFPTYLYRDDQPFDLPGNDGKGIGRTYAQSLIQSDVLQWVRAQRNHPFFLFYAITLPHGRHEIDDLGIYADKPWTLQQKAYAAQVTRLDGDVGQLLNLLKELGLDEKTLVFVAGDNGSSFAPSSELGKLFEQANNGLRGFKRGLYEGALRQAAIARWPRFVPAGRVSHEPWAFWDFLPTAAELAGAKLPPNYKTDGLSLVAFLKGGPAPARDFFYWELHEGKPIQAVRFGNWKAVKNGSEAPLELYDLAADPAEARNLASEKPERVSRALEFMSAAHADDPNWPLTGKAKRRLEDEKGAFEANPRAASSPQSPANSK